MPPPPPAESPLFLAADTSRHPFPPWPPTALYEKPGPEIVESAPLVPAPPLLPPDPPLPLVILILAPAVTDIPLIVRTSPPPPPPPAPCSGFPSAPPPPAPPATSKTSRYLTLAGTVQLVSEVNVATALTGAKKEVSDMITGVDCANNVP